MNKLLRVWLYIHIIVKNYRKLPSWIVIKFSKFFMVKKLSNKYINNNIFDSDGMKVSVVFPTNNGVTNGVEKLINSLTAQTLKPVEIIAVDSGSIDGTQNFLIANGVKLIDNSMNIFHHAHSRNLGAEKAVGDFILFTVDDAVFVDKNWIENAVSLLLKTNAASISGVQKTGNYKDYYSFLKSIWHTRHYEKIYHALSIINCPKWLAKIYNALSLKPRYAPIDDTNHLVRRSVFEKIKFSAGTVEDLEFGARLILAGNSVVFSKFLVIEHGHKYISGNEVSYSKRIALDQRIFRDEFKFGIFNAFTSNVLSSTFYDLMSIQISIVKDNNDSSIRLFENQFQSIQDEIKILDLEEKIFGRSFVESRIVNKSFSQKMQIFLLTYRFKNNAGTAFQILKDQYGYVDSQKFEIAYRYMVINYIVSLVAFSSAAGQNDIHDLDISDWQ